MKYIKVLLAISIITVAVLAGHKEIHASLLKKMETYIPQVSGANGENTCTASPAGGSFATTTPILIKCGNKVIYAYYRWSDSKSYTMIKSNATTVYYPNQNKSLAIQGQYITYDSKHRPYFISFSKVFNFEKAIIPPAPYPYPYYQSKIFPASKQGFKITLPTFSQLISRF